MSASEAEINVLSICRSNKAAVTRNNPRSIEVRILGNVHFLARSRGYQASITVLGTRLEDLQYGRSGSSCEPMLLDTDRPYLE